MKPFHVTLFEDLPAFLTLCQAVAAGPNPQPVFFADGKEPELHFFLATTLFRAHLQVRVTARADEAVLKIQNAGLHVVRAGVRYWADESPEFTAPFDSSGVPF